MELRGRLEEAGAGSGKAASQRNGRAETRAAKVGKGNRGTGCLREYLNRSLCLDGLGLKSQV